MTLVVLAVMLMPSAALAIINPQFTPRDLIRASDRIWLLEVEAPEEGALAAKVNEVLRGEGGEEALEFHLPERLDTRDLERAFRGQSEATAIVLLGADAPAEPGMGGGMQADEPHGMLLVGTEWFAVHREDGQKVLRPDEQQMFSVWGGSARLLAEAVRFVQADPRASFPVRSQLIWFDERKLGTLPDAAAEAIALDLGEPLGRGVLLLSEGGDRFYRIDEDGPEDVTEAVGLETASKRAAVTDLTGDGRRDLVLWEGHALKLLTWSADDGEARFREPQRLAELSECLSLDAITVEGGQGGLLIGTTEGPKLLVPEGEGFAIEPLGDHAEAAAELGSGGFCTVGDFTGNGHNDVMQFHPGGALLHPATGPGRFDEPQRIEIELPDNPRAAVPGDFTHDGRLDVKVGGDGGTVLIGRRGGDDDWADLTHATYELNHHGNQHGPRISTLAASDINSDGRQGVAMFYTERKPMLFFNRGFGCFGWARELDIDAAGQSLAGVDFPIDPADLESLAALGRGQSAAVMADLTGNRREDLFAVAAETHEVWAVFGQRDDARRLRAVEVALPAGATGPVTLTVRDARRAEAPDGVYVLHPGQPITIPRERAGPVELRWVDEAGEQRTEEVIVVSDDHRIELE